MEPALAVRFGDWQLYILSSKSWSHMFEVGPQSQDMMHEYQLTVNNVEVRAKHSRKSGDCLAGV
jgi:hypothetical protein